MCMRACTSKACLAPPQARFDGADQCRRDAQELLAPQGAVMCGASLVRVGLSLGLDEFNLSRSLASLSHRNPTSLLIATFAHPPPPLPVRVRPPLLPLSSFRRGVGILYVCFASLLVCGLSGAYYMFPSRFFHSRRLGMHACVAGG